MERVAILGGGAAGLTAALELSAPERDGAYEVTVYQSGWRLGGKGASGRRRPGAERIEEHGLHVWFGFYDNAFDVIQRCYAELDRPPDAALATWEDAFKPCNDIVLLSESRGRWRRRRWRFPPNDGVPGAAHDRSFRDVSRRAIELLREVLPEEREGIAAGVPAVPPQHRQALEELEALTQAGAAAAEGGAAAPAAAAAPAPVRRGLAEHLDELRDRVWQAGEAEVETLLRLPAGLEDYAMAFDIVATVLRGIVADDLLRGAGFAKINDLDLGDWLLDNGLRRSTLERSPLLRSFYQLCFAYEGGDRTRPSLAAGKAVQALLRIACTYEGAVMWKMQAGMGDTIFAPMYEVLSRRGVRFEFFHHVTRLGVSDDHTLVDEVEIVPQAAVDGGGEYAPLYDDPDGLPCWPAEPDWDQLVDGDELRDRLPPIDYEREANPSGAAAVTLRRGADFDHVVLAIPVGAQRPMCDELAAHSPAFARMLDRSRTVATQALQLWLSADHDQLGWDYDMSTVCGAFAAPLDTYCDMSHLLAVERWPPGEVRHIAYFCGAMQEVPGETPQQAHERARADGLELLHGAAPLWPDARDGEGFNFAWLHDDQGRVGEARYESQYWRANVVGSERYVLTPPGSIPSRLRAGESGYENLALAGDWTRNGICGGSVEAAVTSGLQAAQAISGHPARIPGLDGWLESD